MPEPARLEALVQVFEQIKHDKDSERWRPDADWIPFFEPAALAQFVSWTDDERATWSIPEARSTTEDPSTPNARELHGWNFFSMIDALRNGDYALLSCREIEPGVARLEFEPFGWPFGGRPSLSDDGLGPTTHPRRV